MKEALNTKAQRAILKAIERIADDCENESASDVLVKKAGVVRDLSEALPCFKGVGLFFEVDEEEKES